MFCLFESHCTVLSLHVPETLLCSISRITTRCLVPNYVFLSMQKCEPCWGSGLSKSFDCCSRSCTYEGRSASSLHWAVSFLKVVESCSDESLECPLSWQNIDWCQRQYASAAGAWISVQMFLRLGETARNLVLCRFFYDDVWILVHWWWNGIATGADCIRKRHTLVKEDCQIFEFSVFQFSQKKKTKYTAKKPRLNEHPL